MQPLGVTRNEVPQVLILGIGNILWADEGFGVRAVETLQQLYSVPDNVTVLDGGTQGIYLVQHICDAEILVVFDAVDYGLPGGSLKLVEGDKVPRFLGAKKVSLHQTGFQEVLAMAEMLGGYPRHLLLVGVQPVELEDFGGSLRPAVKSQIKPAIRAALAHLAELGVTVTPHATPQCNTSAQDNVANINRYESERPSAYEACRFGDARVLQSEHFDVVYRPAAIDGISIAVDQHLDGYRNNSSENA